MYTKTNRKRQAERKKTTKPQITTRVGRGGELLAALARCSLALTYFFELKRRMAYSRSLRSLQTFILLLKVCVTRADPVAPDINVTTKNMRIRRCPLMQL